MDIIASSECGLLDNCAGLGRNGGKCFGACKHLALQREPFDEYSHLFECDSMDVTQFKSYNLINFGKFDDSTEFFGHSWYDFKCGFYKNGENYYLGNEMLHHYSNNNISQMNIMYNGTMYQMGKPEILSEAEEYKLTFKDNYGWNDFKDDNGDTFNNTKFMTIKDNEYVPCSPNGHFGFWFKICNPVNFMSITIIR